MFVLTVPAEMIDSRKFTLRTLPSMLDPAEMLILRDPLVSSMCPTSDSDYFAFLPFLCRPHGRREASLFRGA